MKNISEKKSFSSSSIPLRKPEGAEFSPRLPSVYSPPNLKVEGYDKFPLSYSIDVNLTIRLKVSEFTRKQATILVGQALYEISRYGITLVDWLSLEFLYSYLLGQKLDPFELKNPKELELTLLLKIVLSSGSWLSLEDSEQLPEEILSAIVNCKWVPSFRTYSSRKSLFRIDKFLKVRFVPVDVIFERQKGTIRYSSYCKGYGESSRMGRRQKTRPSSETDGEPVDLEKDNLIKLPFDRISQILHLVSLEIKYSFRKRR
jgi:hypothetical protein